MAMGSVGGFAPVGTPRPGPGALPVDILESKLYKPTIRAGVVRRPDLIDRLRTARPVPTVAVVAPAGYGKTTLLALWAEDDDRPFAWVSLDPHDNDPIVLLTHIAVALDRVSPLPHETFDALRTAGVSIPATVVPRLAAALSTLSHPVVLALDDVHHLRDGASLDALVTLVGHVRGTTQIALAGRGMPLPLARHRAQGRALELGVESLAFSDEGARSLLRAAGAELPDEELARLARRTEGWAAGLYLAALAHSETRPSRGLGSDGDYRFIGDFLQSELLSRLSPEDLSFLTRTSVLDRLSGPLCDAVLDQEGSAAELEHLQANNLFIVPLDGSGEWYRYHSLFRDLLRQRLEQNGRELCRELQRRAADWCEADGRLETALHYAQDADDADRVARLAIALAQPMYAAGRAGTVLSWFQWVDERGAVERHPAVAALAAYLCALTGRPAAADRWRDVAERCAGQPLTRDDDGLFAMWLTTVRGVMCRDGVERMRSEVDHPVGILRAGSAADLDYPMRLFLSGVASMLLGDDDAAERRFTDATELTNAVARPVLFSSVLASRAQLALGRGEWGDAETHIRRALSVVHRSHTESHLSSALVFALAARLALHRRDVALARARLVEGQRLRPLLSHAIPWIAVGTLLEMAEVSIGLGDPSAARHFDRDAETVLRRRPDLGSLGKRTDDLRVRLLAIEAAGRTSTTLTSAELRILPLLVTHLSIAGIAERLFVSRHTVKSQAWSMYRKLEVHTRSEAVTRARELGLLEP